MDQEQPTKRHAIIAVLLAVFHPFLAMFYLGRGLRGIVYFTVELACHILAFLAILSAPDMQNNLGMIGIAVIRAVALADALRISLRRLYPATLPWYSRWYALLGSIAVLIAVVVVLRIFVFEPFRMPSESMRPTLVPGDIILADKRGIGNYRCPSVICISDRGAAALAKVQRGDLIVFIPPNGRDIPYIKRVIGMPGDHLRYQHKQLTINGEPVPRTRLGTASEQSGEGPIEVEVWQEALEGRTHSIQINPERRAPEVDMTIPEDAYFVMGDNRDRSNDSVYWGPVPARNVVGIMATKLTADREGN